MSTLSPKVYGKGGPLAIADATADLRKSIRGVVRSQYILVISGLEREVGILLQFGAGNARSPVALALRENRKVSSLPAAFATLRGS